MSTTAPSWERAVGYLGISDPELGPSFALVAGVSDYPNMGGRASDLWPARIDVEKMVAYLEREPESFNEIVVLLDKEVTADTLGYFLTQYFPRRLSESRRSRFLFAYSGHGITADNGRGYILTSEATSLDDPFSGAISMATLRAQFQEVVDRGHQVLALINACYGVDFHRLSLAFGDENDPPPLPSREGAHAITAGGAGELTWSDQDFGDDDGLKGSIFFEAVLAALDARADTPPQDGIVTVDELQTYLRKVIPSFTDERQNPIGADLRSTYSPGSFFFLDRNRQIENANAEPLEGDWWGGIAFGAAPGGDAGQDGAPPEIGSETDDLAARTSGSDLDATIEQIAGRWAGVIDEPGAGQFELSLEVAPDCSAGEACGEIAVSHVPCRGRITLVPESTPDRIEFYVDQFDATSDMSTCTAGAGEFFVLRSDGGWTTAPAIRRHAAC